ncbi:UNVERIFIED_CONTAM: Piezo-type mechanosensitive ion channel [Sesamum calycinum]|uniref:Piezo-type mechanosensitive ion channel n=1 Tax=Sesamum calycinum TaxID=2727403 RepID=A0AAW2SCX3_9LAMI
MRSILSGLLLPLLLLTAGLVNWSLISLINLLTSLLFRFTAPKKEFRFRRRNLSLWFVFIYSSFVILLQVLFLSICASLDPQWSIADAWWIKLLGLIKGPSWTSPRVIYFLVIELLVVLIALTEIKKDKFGFVEFQGSFWRSEDSFWVYLSSIAKHIGYRLRLASCLLLPAVQLVSGISNPSWLSLPFFVCSCVGLVDWSLTSNFLGLFRMKSISSKHLSGELKMDFEQVRTDSEIFMQLSCVKHDLEDMEFIMSLREGNLTEQLLPSRSSFFVHQLRSGVRHTNILLRGPVFRIFSINWFTYGFPISLFALSYWSFHFASICAFGLLAYVGYILYAFPSLFRLHRLNGLLLVFILLWAVSTYVFNVAFAYTKLKAGKDMEIWEMVGLWHYPIPGFFLLAQFCLGILVALGNLVNNSVFLCLSNEERRLSSENETEEVKEDAKVLIVATIAWGLRKCSRAIMLLLIFLIATKPGFIHAAYMIFFFAYLLSHKVNKRMRQSLILLCEAHFAILYILQLNLVSRKLEQKGSTSLDVLSQLGLLESDSSLDFLEIAILACFCAVYNHGFEMLFSFSAIVQHTACPPIGFSILRAGLSKSVLLSVYATSNIRENSASCSHERRIALYLNAIGKKVLSTYRSFGTYIAFLTILIAVYLVRPNYISFGYIFLLLVWIIGRQLDEKTKRRLWFPLKVYAIAVFVFIYILSIFPTFETWMSSKFDLLVSFGYNIEASLSENLSECLAIMIVMQLYSYERRQSEHLKSQDPDPLQLGISGFTKRFLIWHSQKIFFSALFYASLSPISAFGFFYLLGLVFCSALPKASRTPSTSFLIYTGLLVYRPSFEGLEAGLRPKVLVVVACTLQYNVFRWLKMIPSSLLNIDGSEEPCPLFVSAEDLSHLVSISDQDNPSLSGSRELSSQMMEQRNSWSYLRPHIYQQSEGSSSHRGACDGSNRKYDYIWGTMTESYKWKKKRIVALRQERFEMQKTTLRVYLKFWMENMFNLFGLEINMIALLLASFALLNAISMVYIACLATCILLPRPTIRKLWPIFAFLFATVLLAEYFAMWKSMMPLNRQLAIESNARCNDCWKNSNIYFYYCEKCWLGLVVDDPRMLISYYVVFMLTCFKLRADHASGFSWSFTYEQMVSQRKNAFVWRDLSFETKSMWTFLDYLRVYCYCHLLDLVLALILITGTLEYDVLHFGYLGFALIFFRMRLTILKKKNKIFKYLRIYNFAEQEKKAAWKTEHLQHIRKSEENKSQRNLQVEKMKSEMLNLQIQLHGMNSTTAYGNESPTNGGVRRRRNASLTMQDFGNFEKRDGSIDPDQGFSLNMNEYPSSCSITAKDGEWYSVGFNNCKGGFMNCKELQSGSSWSEKAKKVFNLMEQMVEMVVCSCSKHWKSLTQEAESPPYFVQLSMDVKLWPKDGIQPERIESGINQLLQLVHDENCKNEKPNNCPCASKVQIQSIEKNSENANVALVVFEVVYASPSAECEPAEQYNSLTPAADVAKEILKARSMGLAEKVIFYLFNLILSTYAVTEYAWNMDGSQQNAAGFALRAIYLTKAVSLALQAMQIRHGIPNKSTLYRQFLTSEVSRVNYLGYRLYRALPFLYELRCVLDWSCTTTSLTMYDWLKYPWLVPNAVQKQFTMSLSDMEIKFSWVLTRDRPKGKETVKFERSVDPLDLPNSSEVEGVLNGSFSSFRTFNIYPRFFRVTGSGEVRPFVMEVNDVSADLVLHHGSSKWWSFHDINSLDAYGCRGLSGPMAVIVSEETPLGRFIRLQCSDLRMRIPYENLPLCDRLIAICEDIYAARAEGELGVEEVLYWTLVKIYRSPHMLLEYTNPD